MASASFTLACFTLFCQIHTASMMHVTTLIHGDNMKPLYDPNAPKKPANLSINSDLLKKTKALHINLSATLEQALRQKLADTENQKWVLENKKAIKAYNTFVKENGLFSDEHRSF